MLLSLAMLLTYMPALAFADSEAASEQSVSADLHDNDPGETELSVVTGTASASMNIGVDVDLADNDELLMEYLEQGVIQNENTSAKAGKSVSSTRGSRLEGNSQTIYYMLRNAIIDLTDDDDAEVATEYIIEAKQLALDQTTFTAEELNVDTLLETAINEETGSEYKYIPDKTTKALFSKMGVKQSAILDALLSDMPYYLYWFDKTKTTGGLDVTITNVGTIEDSTGKETALTIDNSELTFSFTVAAEYRENPQNKYRVNISKIRAANAARRNAANIITENAGASDYQKLVNYMTKICEMTSYHDAAGNNLVDYGDPWQMIYVFDGDASTEVVCEGYSKAFQFLCDNSDFYEDIVCDSVTGHINWGTGNGDHMWNILHMGDNKNYIADLTNCDEDSIGSADANGGPYLFLNGCRSGGSVADGYHYSCQNGADMFYTYDNDTKNQFAESELTMCEATYSYTEDIAETATKAADTARQKADAAESAVADYKAAADAAKNAADKAVSTLNAQDIADAQAKAKAAESLAEKAKTALEEAEQAETAAADAITKAEEAIKKASGSDADIAANRLSEAKNTAKTASDKLSTAKTNKNTSDTNTASAVKITGDAVKKAADKADEEAKKAAEFAANGNAYIDPALPKVSLKAPKKAKKSFTAKWKKLSKKQQKVVKGIEIEYSTTPDFSTGFKFKSAGKKKSNVKVKGLASKKTYYVRAHTYVIRNGVKYVSYWSAIKKVKVK